MLTLISQPPRAGRRGCVNFLMHTDPDSCVQGSEGVYARECAARPGFSMSFSDPGASRTSFSDYRRLCAKWQHTITSGLRAALQSKNYVQTRNAFLILNTTVKARTFPTSSTRSRSADAAVRRTFVQPECTAILLRVRRPDCLGSCRNFEM